MQDNSAKKYFLFLLSLFFIFFIYLVINKNNNSDIDKIKRTNNIFSLLLSSNEYKNFIIKNSSDYSCLEKSNINYDKFIFLYLILEQSSSCIKISNNRLIYSEPISYNLNDNFIFNYLPIETKKDIFENYDKVSMGFAQNLKKLNKIAKKNNFKIPDKFNNNFFSLLIFEDIVLDIDSASVDLNFIFYDKYLLNFLLKPSNFFKATKNVKLIHNNKIVNLTESNLNKSFNNLIKDHNNVEFHENNFIYKNLNFKLSFFDINDLNLFIKEYRKNNFSVDKFKSKFKYNFSSYRSSNKNLNICPSYDDFIKALSKSFKSTQHIHADKSKVIFLKDKYFLNKDIYFPCNLEVVIEPGSEFIIADGASMYINGPFSANGNKDQKIIFKTLTNWGSVIINPYKNFHKSRKIFINFVEFYGGSESSINNVHSTGMVNILNSDDLTILNSLFANSLGEDSLNIKNSKNIHLDNLKVFNSFSDAIDLDFCEGRMKNISVSKTGSGGDGIDLSGSNISIENSYFNNISDKAISVGENSIANIQNIEIDSSFYGVVSKDSSIVNIFNSIIKNSSIAFSTFIKKNIFNDPQIFYKNIFFDNNDEIIDQLNGSIVELNNEN